LGISPGAAIGKVFLLKKSGHSNEGMTGKEETEKELQKLTLALKRVKEELEWAWKNAKGQVGEEAAEIFHTHIRILEDSQYIRKIEDEIRYGNRSAAQAVEQVTEEFVAGFNDMEDEYFRDRIWDFKAIGDQVIQGIFNRSPEMPDLPDMPMIVVTDELTPFDTLYLGRHKVVGIITSRGGKNSHAAILARSMEIPAVAGIEMTSLEENQELFIDGSTGEVIPDPGEKEQMRVQEWNISKKERQRLLTAKDMGRAQTLDHIEISLNANIDVIDDMDRFCTIKPQGIGLVRTESLLLRSDWLMDEEYQYSLYRKVAERAEHRPVVFRTMDIGGDKLSSILPADANDSFLGSRGIRFNLQYPHTLLPQLKALLRAAVHGNVKILFPMISNLGEWRRARQLVEMAADELDKEHKDYKKVPLGMMIEIPGAALMTDIFAKEVDFFSIGTNDLCQYLLAVDRTDEQLHELYQPFHPAMLRLIQYAVQKAGEARIPISLCGEMASDELALVLLLGLGLRSLSMNLSAIPLIRQRICSLSLADCEETAQKALHLSTAREIEDLVRKKHRIY